MEATPKSNRLHIGLFGRANVGKSSLLNYIAGQDVAITSPTPGTTTDVVEKPMELLPIGPVVFLDTAGLDDDSEIGALRVRRTEKVFDRADLAVLVLEPGRWGPFEEKVVEAARGRSIPLVAVLNKVDTGGPSEAVADALTRHALPWMPCSCVRPQGREAALAAFKRLALEHCPEDFLAPPPLVADLVPAGGLAVLVVPIDLGAPKGRLILPQVQTIRDLLDGDAAALVVKEREYAAALARLSAPPDLAVCDSQIVLKMVADTPPGVPCTTFSILFSRLKGDIVQMARGAAAIDALKPGDKVLVGEACSHHPLADDIGRVKIPRWLRQHTGCDVHVDICAGRDYPDDLAAYKLVVHCGGCMLTRRETLARLQKARAMGVPVTNYGICIAHVQGVARRVLSPFPAALDAYERELLEAAARAR